MKGHASVPSDYFLSALWKDVKVKVSGANLPDSTLGAYPFQSKINMLLSVKDESVLTNYVNGLYIEDTPLTDPKRINPFDQRNNGMYIETDELLTCEIPNSVLGLTRRYVKAGSSTKATLRAPLFVNGLTDLNPSRLLPMGMEVQLTFVGGAPEFYLTCNDETKPYFRINKMHVECTCHELTPQASQRFMSSLHSKGPAKFNYKEKHMGWNVVTAGSTMYRFAMESLLLPDQSLPDLVFLTFVNRQAYEGTYKYCSLYFECELS